jgi:hypothetical protein
VVRVEALQGLLHLQDCRHLLRLQTEDYLQFLLLQFVEEPWPSLR